ncbi:MAG: CRISPR system precrRNA processing endoribonuclease RAMP protein Cas6, partial [Acidobacteriota bacterium]
LCAFYGPGPLDLDFKALGEAAERVETVADETGWVERTRLSTRRGVAHDLSGFAGKITFRGEMAPFLPLLRIGEYVHVGKNAVFGNGWYVVHRRQ